MHQERSVWRTVSLPSIPEPTTLSQLGVAMLWVFSKYSTLAHGRERRRLTTLPMIRWRMCWQRTTSSCATAIAGVSGPASPGSKLQQKNHQSNDHPCSDTPNGDGHLTDGSSVSMAMLPDA